MIGLPGKPSLSPSPRSNKQRGEAGTLCSHSTVDLLGALVEDNSDQALAFSAIVTRETPDPCQNNSQPSLPPLCLCCDIVLFFLLKNIYFIIWNYYIATSFCSHFSPRKSSHIPLLALFKKLWPIFTWKLLLNPSMYIHMVPPLWSGFGVKLNKSWRASQKVLSSPHPHGLRFSSRPDFLQWWIIAWSVRCVGGRLPVCWRRPLVSFRLA